MLPVPHLTATRLRYGLFWGRSYPNLNDFKFLVKPLVATLIILTVITTTAYTKELTESDKWRKMFFQIDKDFADCLKGTWRHTTVEGDELGCWPVEVNRR